LSLEALQRLCCLYCHGKDTLSLEIIEKDDKIAEKKAKKKKKKTLSRKPNLIMYFMGIYGNFA